MSADSFDNFEYEPARLHEDEAMRHHYWAIAIGLQAVDGVRASRYVEDLAAGYRAGTYSLAQTGGLVRAYHASPSVERETTREADLVSQRIAELLAASPFVLAPDILKQIHHYPFQNLNRERYRPGRFKGERMVKKEDMGRDDGLRPRYPAL